jgi:hypothetical protein
MTIHEDTVHVGLNKETRLKVGCSTLQSALQNISGLLRRDAVAMEVVTKALRPVGSHLPKITMSCPRRPACSIFNCSSENRRAHI